MRERLTPRTLRGFSHRPIDMSIPASVLPSIQPPDKPQTSFGETITKLEELRYRIRKEASDLTQVQTLRREQDELLIGVLSRGLSGNVPDGFRVQFAPSDNNPNGTLHITVIERGQIHPFYLSDKRRDRTPIQERVISKARAVISSGG